jgi:hypothetical protein
MADEGVSLSDKTTVGMPIRNLIGLIGTICVGAWGYFGILERLNVVETNQILMQADVTKNSTFSELWPRGQLSAHSLRTVNNSC